MNNKLKSGLTLFLLVVFVLGLNIMALADYPEREINLIVPWGEGGMTDMTARSLAPLLEKELGQPFVVENRTGASGGIGTAYVARAKTDGYTLLFTAETPALLQVLGISDNSFDDFEMIKVLTMGVPVVTVQKDAPWDSVEDLVEYARENPGEVKVGHAGPGTSGHIATLLLEKLEGVDFTEVPYDGGGPAITATLGGHVDLNFQSPTSVVEYVRSGDLKVIGSFTNEPLSFMPDVTPIGKVFPELSGYLPWGPWYGLVAPKGTPDDVVEELRNAVNSAIKTDKWKDFVDYMMAIGLYYEGDEAEEFIDNWQSVTTWLLYNADAAENSPAEYGIPKP